MIIKPGMWVKLIEVKSKIMILSFFDPEKGKDNKLRVQN